MEDKQGNTEFRSETHEEVKEEQEGTRKKKNHDIIINSSLLFSMPSFPSSLPSDILSYLLHYPNHREDFDKNSNYLFYSNQLRSSPNRFLIDEFHRDWFGQYTDLELEHGFIQWIFPLFESGMNFSSQVLQRHEVEKMRADDKIRQRIIKSYELMLDFYGFQLLSPITGEVIRSANYQIRFHNLVRHPHNFLRITRILKSLGEFGLEHLKLGWCLRLLLEIQEKTLKSMSLIKSAQSYWFWTLRSEFDMRVMDGFRAVGRRAEADQIISENFIKQTLEQRKLKMEEEQKNNQPNDEEAGEQREHEEEKNEN